MRSFIQYAQLFTKAESKTIVSKIIRYPITRIFIAIIFLVPGIMLHSFIYETFITGITNTTLGIILKYTEITFICILLFFSYKLFTRLIEKRFALEVSTRQLFKEIVIGLLLGGGLIIFMILLFIITGSIRFEGFNSSSILIDRIFIYGIGSLIEEFLFTIIIFKLVEEAFGSWAALIVNALIFGFAHILNDNATVWTSIAIAISNPIIVVSFIITRRIWMSWALHLSWNYFQAAVFNMPNSGIDQGGFLQTTINGPEWLTGGSFGVEASIVSVALNFCVGIFLLLIAIRKDQLIKPLWLRRKE